MTNQKQNVPKQNEKSPERHPEKYEVERDGKKPTHLSRKEKKQLKGGGKVHGGLVPA